MTGAATTRDDRAKLRFYYTRLFRPGLYTDPQATKPGNTAQVRRQRASSARGQCDRCTSLAKQAETLSWTAPATVCESSSSPAWKQSFTSFKSLAATEIGPLPKSTSNLNSEGSLSPASDVLLYSAPRREHLKTAEMNDTICPTSPQTCASDGDIHSEPDGCAQPFSPEDDRPHSVRCVRPQEAKAVPPSCAGALRRPTSASPRHMRSSPSLAPGSIYYHARGKDVETGPGHYDLEPQSTTPGPSAWAKHGSLSQELNLATCGMYNVSGPACYDFDYTSQDRKQGSCFAKTTTDRSSSERPMYSHADARFAHHAPKMHFDDGIDATSPWAAWQQSRAGHRPIARLDQANRKERLEFEGASWRLGGYLILPSGGDAGPRRPDMQVAERCGARRRAQIAAEGRHSSRGQSPKGSQSFTRARRF